MWSLQEDVDAAIRALGLDAELRPIERDEARRRNHALEERWTSNGRHAWIWTDLNAPHVAHRIEEAARSPLLRQLLVDTPPDLLFFADAYHDRGVAYVGTARAIIAVLETVAHDEYVIVPSDLAWLVCENHHEALIAAGEPAMTRFRAAEPRAQEGAPQPKKPETIIRRLVAEHVAGARAHWAERGRALAYEDAPHVFQWLVGGDARERAAAVELLRLLDYTVEVDGDTYRVVEPRHHTAVVVHASRRA